MYHMTQTHYIYTLSFLAQVDVNLADSTNGETILVEGLSWVDNTRDEFSNMSVTNEDTAFSRDAYAMSHFSAVNLACTHGLVYLRPSVWHKPVFCQNCQSKWDQVNNVARQAKDCGFQMPKTLAKFQQVFTKWA